MISLLRFIAMLLITNSHFGVLYPNGFEILASGGAIGNALFMFCSGYALYASIQKLKANKVITRKKDSINWFFRRYLRIYPSVWVFRLFQFFILGVSFKISMLIIPGYWFLNAILLFYILFYFIVYYFDRQIIYIMISLIVPYLIIFFIQPSHSVEFMVEQTGNVYRMHYFYYFAIMLFGAITYKYELQRLPPPIYV